MSKPEMQESFFYQRVQRRMTFRNVTIWIVVTSSIMFAFLIRMIVPLPVSTETVHIDEELGPVQAFTKLVRSYRLVEDECTDLLDGNDPEALRIVAERINVEKGCLRMLYLGNGFDPAYAQSLSQTRKDMLSAWHEMSNWMDRVGKASSASVTKSDLEQVLCKVRISLRQTVNVLCIDENDFETAAFELLRADYLHNEGFYESNGDEPVAHSEADESVDKELESLVAVFQRILATEISDPKTKTAGDL